MDTRTGDLYASKDAALKAGVPEKHIVKLSGPKKAIEKVQKAVRKLSKNRAKAERQKARKRGKGRQKGGRR